MNHCRTDESVYRHFDSPLTRQQEYLDMVAEVSRRKVLSRIMYLAELGLPFPG